MAATTTSTSRPRRPRKSAVAAIGFFFFVALMIRPRLGAIAYLSRDSNYTLSGENPTEREQYISQPDPNQCFSDFPWIQEALDEFFQPSVDAAQTSTQSSLDSLDAMDNITWYNDYHPGHDRITLTYNGTLQAYEMSVETKFKANQPHKQECMLIPLRAAIDTYGRALAEAFDRKPLQFVVQTEDFAMVWRNTGSKLPPFSLSTDGANQDVPVPDFTYGCYPEAGYSNSSWPAIAELLHKKSEMLGWVRRRDTIFHRSNWDVGPRRGLMPLLNSISANGTAKKMLGTELDIADTGFILSKPENFVWLDEQCASKVALHTAGFSYSAALKYKLACGSLVLMFNSDYREFYDPALKDGVHVIRLPATHEGVNEAEFRQYSAPKIKKAVEEALKSNTMPEIAKKGQEFAMQQLNTAALSCYWYGALLRYGDLYFMGNDGLSGRNDFDNKEPGAEKGKANQVIKRSVLQKGAGAIQKHGG